MQTVEKKYPNAGPGCDLGRYRTGEVPQLGDVVKAHGKSITPSDIHTESDEPREFTVQRVWFAADGSDSSVSNDADDTSGWYSARFDLISRAVPSPAESPASGGGEAFHLQGKHVGWEGVTRDGRKITVVEFVEWPKANGTTEEACRVRDHQTQWAVRLNGRLRTCKEDADDVVGPWVEPPPPTLAETVQAYIDDIGWLNQIVKNPKFEAMQEALQRAASA